jgi:hypothetical protein
MLQRLTSRLRQPVQRQGAEHYLLAMLLSFAASVTLTRLFLALTGYPQLGGGELHIAHALWGGLLLYLASLLPLLFANRWALLASAVLGGTGVGLFIDEVGKFITQSNDYFYPLAAPIVYAFFVMSVMLYARVRRARPRNVRAELFQVFDAMEEVLEQDLDPQERDALEARLRYVADHTNRPELARLADELREFLHFEQLGLAVRRPTLTERLADRWRQWETAWVTRRRMRVALAVGLAGLGLATLAETGLATAVFTTLNPPPATAGAAMGLEGLLGLLRELRPGGGVFWYTGLVLESSVAFMLLVAGGLLLLRRDQSATAFGYLGLLLSLTAANLLIFYYSQFAAIVTAGVQLVLFMGLAYYRGKYLTR